MDRNRDRRNNLSLDGLNFFLADVRDGLGPYLAIYLLAVHRWDPASIGVVMTVAAMAGLVAQAPAGALIDRVRSKRAVVAVAALMVTLGCLVLPFTSSFGLVALTQALGAVAASVFAPAIAAISLGITGARAFTRRTGRNETFNHAGNAHLATPLTSACIVAAQLVMVPMAWLVGVKADAWGRKPLLLAGFLILPIRGVLYVLSDDPYWLVAVQLLDGIGAGLFGALFPLVVKDLTQGTGRFNVSLGVLSTVFGFGAALSNSLAGFVVQGAGYSAAFLTLAAIAALAFGLLLAMPETFMPSRAPQPGTLAVPDGEVA